MDISIETENFQNDQPDEEYDPWKPNDYEQILMR